ncbi:uncharacterized protein LOC119071003 [Bradysia coprophila]|uniref:uncharacterized protein LOC119071003 n=1 Tax=Bradysia coprophila TaxID=38358 RepID=UPI00187D9777|nr:uncharacterized protein LOC119071003 [Bradysia coprophila]
MVKKAIDYSPFYPTTLGTKSHDVTLRQLPAYSIRPKPEIKDKCYSPGPGAYPKDDRKKGFEIPKPLYPADNSFKYSIGVRGKEPKKFQTPSPAAYPRLEEDRNPLAKNEIHSIYPKDNANKFSIGVRRQPRTLPKSPGPATFPRDKDTSKNLNSLLPEEKGNKFTIPERRMEKNVRMSPGPAQYPCVKKALKNEVMSIYPAPTQLLPTMKARHDVSIKHRIPAPNVYPLVEEAKADPKEPKDLTKKMIPGKRSPLYSIGVKHSPKQHILILKEDEY